MPPPPPPELVTTVDALPAAIPSRRGAHRSVRVPPSSFWRKLAASRGRVSGRGRLYGPRQLGDRHCRRLGLRLPTALRHRPGQPHGHVPAALGGQAGHRHGSRSGSGLSRALQRADANIPVAALRGGDHRLRLGRARSVPRSLSSCCSISSWSWASPSRASRCCWCWRYRSADSESSRRSSCR